MTVALSRSAPSPSAVLIVLAVITRPRSSRARAPRHRAGLDASTDFYLATKHVGVSLLWKQGVSTRAIAAQMGWSERAVDDLLRVYGHKDLAALEEIDALYADQRDAPVTHEAPDRLLQRD